MPEDHEISPRENRRLSNAICPIPPLVILPRSVSFSVAFQHSVEDRLKPSMIGAPVRKAKYACALEDQR